MEIFLDILKVSILGLFSGIILNFMPCVLPLIALKISSFTKNENKKAIAGFTIAGILTFCLLLALIFSLFQSLYWGFQLQFPSVISLLIFLFLGLILALFGVFDLKVTLHISKMKSQALEGFVSGFLTVVFSLSCIAPIVASAVSFAFLSGKWYVIFFCLFFMGLGLSIPYFLAGFCGVRIDFKNGGFGSKFAKLISFFALLTTLLYLIFILHSQVGMLVALLILSISIASFVLFLKFKKKTILGLTALFVIAIPLFKSFVPVDEKVAEYVPFSQLRVNSYIQNGYTIFLNVEAGWCVTCKVNDKIALDTAEFKAYLKQNNIIYMKADLTVKNPEIESFIKQFGGFGVPFYVVFVGGELYYKVIPPILSLQTLIYEIEHFKQNYANKRGK